MSDSPIRPPKKFHPEPFAYHQEVELTIDSLTNLGVGLGKIEGWVVFVPFTLPGEKVKGRIYRNDSSYSHADLVEVISPSPDRTAPQCVHFGTCGGCQYQHLSYQKQLEWKQQQVEELLLRMAQIEFPVSPTIPSPAQWNYRSKLTPHFQKPKGSTIGPIGFLSVRSRNQIVDVAQCPIAMPEINDALPSIRNQVHKSASQYKKGATLLLRATEGRVETNHQSVIAEKVGSLEFHFLAGDFFQNNPFILEAFTSYAKEEACQDGCEYLVDAYCGSGLFALSLASSFKKVIGVEVSETSADWARHNAESNKIDNASFLAASAEEIFKEVAFPPDQTCILIDPPRKGCSPDFLAQLFTFRPKRVVYISCNPSTQIRDLQEFDQQGYELSKVQPFDLFPQTKHLECVATLVRKGSA